MKVLLIGNYLPIQQRSMNYFAQFLHDQITATGIECRLIRPPAVFGALKPSEYGIGKWLGYVDRFLIFPFLLKRQLRWADVVHLCDHSNGMYVRHFKHKPHLITCHDLISIQSAKGELPQQRLSWTGRLFQSLVLNGLKQGKHFACVSAHTQNELMRLAGIPSDNIRVIYNGLIYPYRPMPSKQARERLDALSVPPRPFLLHVGGNQFYKNRLGVLRIFRHVQQARPDFALVMAGKPFTQPMRDFIQAHGMASIISELTRCDNEDLRALYSSAEALLFPSLYEGFGWPIIEAQACGCAVITTARPPMTEVAGLGAIFVEPDDPITAAETIVNDLCSVARIVQLGRANAENFENSAMTSQYIIQYNFCLHNR